MKHINFAKIPFLSLFIILLVSCENNISKLDVEDSVLTAVNVNNGYLTFDNNESFLSTYNYLSKISNSERKIWSSKLNYISLKTNYEKRDDLFRSTGDSIYVNSDRLSNSILSILFNERGILMIGNEIVKIQGPYSYSITDGDFSTLERIEKGEDISNFKNVIAYRHTKELQSEYICKAEEQPNNEAQLRDSETSGILWHQGKRREYVKFIAEINIAGDFKVLNLEIHGRAQNYFLFYWGLAFDDEMVSAKISLLSGKYSYPTVTYNFDPISSSTVLGEEVVGLIGKNFGLATNATNINVSNLKVKYTFIKHTGQSSSSETIVWEGNL